MVIDEFWFASYSPFDICSVEYVIEYEILSQDNWRELFSARKNHIILGWKILYWGIEALFSIDNEIDKNALRDFQNHWSFHFSDYNQWCLLNVFITVEEISEDCQIQFFKIRNFQTEIIQKNQESFILHLYHLTLIITKISRFLK